MEKPVVSHKVKCPHRLKTSCFALQLPCQLAHPHLVAVQLVLLGDTSVGKSCLVVRFCRGEFFDYQEPTIGAAFLTQTVQLDDATVRFEVRRPTSRLAGPHAPALRCAHTERTMRGRNHLSPPSSTAAAAAGGGNFATVFRPF